MSQPRARRRRRSASQDISAFKQLLTTKRRGELSELAFAHKAASEGFGVAKPYGDSEPFDFILISHGWPEGDKLWRVQVKSTATLKDGFYHVNTHRYSPKGVVAYTPKEVDFLVAHIVPDDSWFIFPIAILADCRSLSLRPKNSTRPGVFEGLRDFWDRLRPPKQKKT